MLVLFHIHPTQELICSRFSNSCFPPCSPEKNLPCRGCNNIPKCKPYTEYGIAHGKSKSGNAANQDGVVKAVQEWMSELDDPRVTLHHTTEDFTAESLKSNGIDYHLVITNTRNPSWFIVKPF